MGASGQLEHAEVPAEAQLSASLSDSEALELGRFAVAIEEHYSRKAGRLVLMDVEWAKDADDGRLYILHGSARDGAPSGAAGRDRGLLADAGEHA